MIAVFCVVVIILTAASCEAVVFANDTISDVLKEYGGIGLTAWSIEGSTSNLCALGAAGSRASGEGDNFVVTKDSRHHIGSVTKSMTSTLLAILMEPHNVNNETNVLTGNKWSTTLGNILEVAQNTPYENVSLRELTGMLSGIPGNPRMGWEHYHHIHIASNSLRCARAAMTNDTLSSDRPVTDPGTTFMYSNLAYIVAGHIVEEITGLVWEEALVKYLLNPLSGGTIHNIHDLVGAPNSPHPWGHNHGGRRKFKPCDPSRDRCDNFPVLGPAGTVSVSVSVMARYFAFHVHCHNGGSTLNGSSNGSGEDTYPFLLSQEACQQLHQPANPAISRYGYGWVCEENKNIREWANGTTCTHDGSNAWNYYRVWLAFGIDRAFVGFANSADLKSNLMLEFAMVDSAIVQITLPGKDGEDCSEPFDGAMIVNNDNTETTNDEIQFSDFDYSEEICLRFSSSYAAGNLPPMFTVWWTCMLVFVISYFLIVS